MHIVILGCGQLSRLMAKAGLKLGKKFTFVAIGDESIDCVAGMGPIVRWHKPMSAEALLQATGVPDVVIVERENIDVKLLLELSMHCKVYPGPEAVANCQHRLKEKLALKKLNLPATPWRAISDKQSLDNAAEIFGFPLIIKSFVDGYDGKNQWHIQNAAELDALIAQVEPVDWIVEPKINFSNEVSLIGVRSSIGDVKFYSLTENHHERGILKRSIAPYEQVNQEQLSDMQAQMKRLMNSWQYVGVIAMEMFVTDSGFLINELAPRVHNSGHWTDNSLTTSQFENHIRAIAGMPLGPTQTKQYTGMVNILGASNRKPKVDSLDGDINLYDKQPRLGRKLGHVNLTDVSRDKLLTRMLSTEQQIYSS